MMTGRGIRRKKSSLSEVKVAVVGAPSVGKSALTVRFLTKRYIGEYDHQQDSKYKHEVLMDGEPVLFEILDTSPKLQLAICRQYVLAGFEGALVVSELYRHIQSLEDVPGGDVAQWADCVFLVYSITDRGSFNYIRKARHSMQRDLPTTLVGNKADMVHLRQVSHEEGEILAKDFECNFSEVSASEQVNQIGDVFQELCREVLSMRRKAKHSLLNRMLGSKSVARVYSRGKSDSAITKD